MAGKYILWVTDEILNEYEEIIYRKTEDREIARNVVSAIINRSNTRHIEVYYRFGLIESDNDDNKFVDCAIKANARFVVTEDHHFNILKTIPFPHVEVVGINFFLDFLSKL